VSSASRWHHEPERYEEDSITKSGHEPNYQYNRAKDEHAERRTGNADYSLKRQARGGMHHPYERQAACVNGPEDL
jgi:hypothetical protein